MSYNVTFAVILFFYECCDRIIQKHIFRGGKSMKRIFVSSTFVDMNAERDAIAQVVAPALNKHAKKYGESVSFCDLRWGIDTSELESEEGSKKVLSICLDEIDDCAPYMVVLLGERYGWIPSADLIQKTVDTKPQFKLDDLEKSVTALEIEYGALQTTEQLAHTLFYFREIKGDVPDKYLAEDEKHESKLLDLKRRIKSIAGDNLKYYTLEWDHENQLLLGIDQFAQMVTEDIQSLMEEEWKEEADLPIYEKDYIWQRDYMYQRVRPYSCGRAWMDEYLERASIFLKLYSDKTTIVSSIAAYAIEQGWNVVPVFCGQTDSCCTVSDTAKYIIYQLERILKFEHDNNLSDSLESLQDRLIFMCEIYAKSEENNLLIFLDDVEKLEVNDKEEVLRIIPSNLSERVRMIGTMNDISYVPYGFSFPLGSQSHIRPTSRDVINYSLKSMHRELSDEVIDAILEKPTAHMFDYLELLVYRLCMMDAEDYAVINRLGGDMKAIVEYQKRIIANSGDYFELPYQVFLRAAVQMGNIDLYIALEYIAASSYGLREEDLVVLLKRIDKEWNGLDFRRYVLYLKKYLIVKKDGRISIDAHIRPRITPYGLSYENRCGFLLEYLLNLNSDEPTIVRELVGQCVRGRYPEIFMSYLTTHQDEPEIKKLMAKELRKRIRDGNVGFIRSLYDHATEEHLERMLVSFINEQGYYILSKPSRIMHEDVNIICLPRQVEFAEKLLREDRTTDSIKDYMDACILAGKIFMEYGSTDSIELAKECYQKGLDMMDEYLNLEITEGKKEQTLKRTFDVLCDFGAFYRSRESLDYELVLDIYGKAVRIYEQLIELDAGYQDDIKLVYIYVHMGDVYRERKEYPLAISYYLMSYEKYENLKQEIGGNTDFDASYAIVCERLFLCYQKEQDYTQSAYYLDKCYEICKPRYERIPSLYWCEMLAFVYLHYAELYRVSDEAESRAKTMEMYELCVQLQNLLLSNGPVSADYLKWTAKTENTAADFAHFRLKGIENDNKAIRYYRMAIEHYKKLRKTFGADYANKNLLKIYKQIGSIFQKYGGLNNNESALLEYKDAFYIAITLYRERPESGNATMVKDCIRQLVYIYKGLEKYSFEEARKDLFIVEVFASWDYSEFVEEFKDRWAGKPLPNPFDF